MMAFYFGLESPTCMLNTRISNTIEHFVIAKEFTFKRNKSIKMKDECSQFKNNVL